MVPDGLARAAPAVLHREQLTLGRTSRLSESRCRLCAPVLIPAAEQAEKLSDAIGTHEVFSEQVRGVLSALDLAQQMSLPVA